jgi:hypothetical protein
MAYGLKYYGSFKDYFDRTVLINISERDYSGATTEMKLAGAALEYSGSNSELFTPIITSSLTINVVSETNFQYIDLYSSDATKYKVVVQIDTVDHWIGFIIPDLFTEPYVGAPYISQIVATDGVKNLENEEFDITSVSNQISILAHCLNKIEEGRGYYDSINIYEENQNYTSDYTPLTQTYVDCNRYTGKNCYEVIQDICLNYGARLYQKDGAWHIVSVHEFKGSLSVRAWYGGTAPQTPATYDPELLIGNAEDNKVANVDQTLNILPGWKKYNTLIDLKKKESFILNYDFSEWVITGYVTRRNAIWEPVNWPGTAATRRTVTGSESYLFFTDVNSTPQKFITQTINNFFEGDRRLKFDIEFAILRDRVAPGNQAEFWIRVEMYDGGSNYYYLNSNGAWETSLVYINLENVQQTDGPTWQKYSVISDDIPCNGSLYVSVYASSDGQLALKTVKGEIISPEQVVYPDTFTHENPVNVQNNYIPDDIELMTSDFPDYLNDDELTPTDDVANEQHIYYGGLFLDSSKSTVTQQWQTAAKIATEGFTNAKHLHKIVADEKLIMSIPQWAITGTILSENLKPDSCIIDYGVNNKKYLFCNGVFDLQSAQCNGTFIEIGAYSGGDWILADGTWNDDGIWIDGETWNDTDPTP